MEEEKYIGYIKYEGGLVEEGLMDAKRQAKALLCFDSSLRYLIGKQAPDFRGLDFEIPVRIRKGSWEALIPETVAGWVQAGLGLVTAAYFTKMAQKMAEKDFADFGVTDLFKNAISALMWFAKIGKHMGDLKIRTFDNTRFADNNSLIGIRNARGEYLYVPKYMLELYSSCSPKLLEQMAQNIEEGRELKIGSIIDGNVDEVSISVNDIGKNIFVKRK